MYLFYLRIKINYCKLLKYYLLTVVYSIICIYYTNNNRDGKKEGTVDDQHPYIYPQYFAYVLILVRIKEDEDPRIITKGSPRVPNSQIAYTFFVFEFDLIILK